MNGAVLQANPVPGDVRFVDYDKDLSKGNFLSVYDKPYRGRNRRYYKITEDGDKMCKIYREEWGSYKRKIDKIIMGGDEDKDE